MNQMEPPAPTGWLATARRLARADCAHRDRRCLRRLVVKFIWIAMTAMPATAWSLAWAMFACRAHHSIAMMATYARTTVAIKLPVARMSRTPRPAATAMVAPRWMYVPAASATPARLSFAMTSTIARTTVAARCRVASTIRMPMHATMETLARRAISAPQRYVQEPIPPRLTVTTGTPARTTPATRLRAVRMSLMRHLAVTETHVRRTTLVMVPGSA